MSGRRTLVLAVVLGNVLAVFAAGCQDREVVGAVPVKSVLVMAAIGGTIIVTAEEDPVLAGLTLRIPAGSLARDLTVTIERGAEDIVGAMTLPAGPAVIVGPVGTPLSVPARLTLPAGQGTMSDRLIIEARDPDGRNSALRAFPSGTGAPPTVLGEIHRFAAFQPAKLRPGAPWPDGGVLPPPPPTGP